MFLNIKIDLENDDFEGDEQHDKIKCALLDIARKIEGGSESGEVLDSRKQVIGNFTIEGR